MPLKKKSKSQLTLGKIRQVLLGWLDRHEADMAADFKPESEAWRQQLAQALAEEIFIVLGIKHD